MTTCFFLFPGAGCWFGQVEPFLSFSNRSHGLWLPGIDWAAKEKIFFVVVMNPNLLKYDSSLKRDVYRAHVEHVMKVLKESGRISKVRKVLFCAYSLGAPMALSVARAIQEEGEEKLVKVAIMDGVEDEGEEEKIPALNVKKWNGDRDHRYTPGDCFKEVMNWLSV